MNPENLLQASEKEFREAVEREVTATFTRSPKPPHRNGFHSPEMRKALGGNPYLADRWRHALLRLKHSLRSNGERLTPEQREYAEHVRGLIVEIATVKSLIMFSDDDFQDVVDDETRRIGGKQLKTLLFDPALIVRWQLLLVNMKSSVESQMLAREDDVRVLQLNIDSPDRSPEEQGLTKDELRAKRIEAHRTAETDFTKWRAGARRFAQGVEERLLEIERVREERNAFKAEDHAIALYMVQILVEGIEAHKAQMMTEYEPDDISEIDRNLWKLIPLQS